MTPARDEVVAKAEALLARLIKAADGAYESWEPKGSPCGEGIADEPMNALHGAAYEAAQHFGLSFPGFDLDAALGPVSRGAAGGTGEPFKCRVPRGTLVGQDFAFYKWPGEYESRADEVFEARYFDERRVVLRAHGFGLHDKPDSYGNGALFVQRADVLAAESPSPRAEKGGERAKRGDLVRVTADGWRLTKGTEFVAGLCDEIGVWETRCEYSVPHGCYEIVTPAPAAPDDEARG